MLMGFKDFTRGSLMDQDLSFASPDRLEQGQKWDYKHKIHNIYCQVTITIFTSQKSKIGTFLVCSNLVNQHTVQAF